MRRRNALLATLVILAFALLLFQTAGLLLP